jgi:hypothetical protein
MESDFHRLRRRKTDLDPRIWFLRIHDHGLVWLHIYELVIDLFYGFQGKFLVFSHFEFPAATPCIDESGHRLGRGGDLFLHQGDLRMGILVFEEQLRNIDISAVLIALMFLGELDDLKVSAADNVAYL